MTRDSENAIQRRTPEGRHQNSVIATGLSCHFHRKVRHVYRLILRSTHRLGAVVEVNHAVAEASFGQQIEP
jgi:hypothetical protein